MNQFNNHRDSDSDSDISDDTLRNYFPQSFRRRQVRAINKILDNYHNKSRLFRNDTKVWPEYVDQS